MLQKKTRVERASVGSSKGKRERVMGGVQVQRRVMLSIMLR